MKIKEDLYCELPCPSLHFKNNLRGTATHNQKLAYFVLYLKIINTFLKKWYASYRRLSKKLKNSIKI